MHWLQLQFTSCEALPSVWIGFSRQYSQACGHPRCLCTFSYTMSSFQSTFFETALFEQPPLSAMTLCDLPSLWRVSMFVFWIIAKSAVFPVIVVSKNKRYPECILYGWSFIETHLYLRYQTHSVTYCLIIVIDKIPENIEIIFCQYRTSLLPKVI